MKDKVMLLLEDKVNEVFTNMQDELNINNGDIMPLEKFELDKCMENLGNIITLVLKNQMEN